MAIPFRCPNCDQSFKAPDRAGGTDFSCPECSTLILLPDVSDDDPLESRGDRSREPRRRRSQPQAIHYHVSNAGAPEQQGIGLAVTGMILGIIGVLVSPFTCFGWVLGALLGVLGIVFSSIGIAQTFRANRGKAMAFTGLILSILALFSGPVIDIVVLGGVAVVMAAAAPKGAPPGGNVPAPNLRP